MATAVVPKEMHDTFTLEQKEYLQGFLLGVAKRGNTFFTGNPSAESGFSDKVSDVEIPGPPVATFFGASVDDLSKEEQLKYDENPLDIWDKLVVHATENRAPEGGDIFRFKFHGLFYVAPTQDSFMLRLRTPGCMLTSNQMRGLADLAEQMGPGEAHITTRGNIQIRQLQPKDIVRVLMSIQSLGLSSRGSGADNIRNITATPTSGLDRQELIDVLPLARALDFYIGNSRDLYGLPRKFNVALDSGGAIGVVADSNDIAFIATRVGSDRAVPAGVYFRIQLCGITGHRQFASDCGVLLMPDQVIAVAAAMIRVFNDNGDRTDRKKARLKYLIDRWSIAKFLEETEKRLDFPLLRFPIDLCERRQPIDRRAHTGVHMQKQPGFAYIGVAIPVGRLSTTQMRALAQTAEEHGSSELRLTVWQNLLVPNIPFEKIEAVRSALAAVGLSDAAGTFASSAVACTGSRGCRYAATDTKRHALELAQHLDARFTIDQPLNLHVTGCPHSCAQHYIGDIGLLGTKISGEEGYQVVIGGGVDDRQGLARELLPAVRFTELPSFMERLMAAYGERRTPDESFLDYTRRHSIEEILEQISNREQS